MVSKRETRFCRDRGMRRGWAGALCLSWWQDETMGIHYPIQSAKFIRIKGCIMTNADRICSTGVVSEKLQRILHHYEGDQASPGTSLQCEETGLDMGRIQPLHELENAPGRCHLT